VDVEFGELEEDGYYAVDVGSVEIRTKGAKFSRIQNSDPLDVTGPIVREENAKAARSNNYAWSSVCGHSFRVDVIFCRTVY
jgi:hypothetical protein